MTVHAAAEVIEEVTGLPRLGSATWAWVGYSMFVGFAIAPIALFVYSLQSGFHFMALLLCLGLSAAFGWCGSIVRRRPIMLESKEHIVLRGRRLQVVLSRNGQDSIQEYEVHPGASAIITSRKPWEGTLAGEDGEVTETVICLVATDGRRAYFGGRMDPLERHHLRDRINAALAASQP